MRVRWGKEAVRFRALLVHRGLWNIGWCGVGAAGIDRPPPPRMGPRDELIDSHLYSRNMQPMRELLGNIQLMSGSWLKIGLRKVVQHPGRIFLRKALQLFGLMSEHRAHFA